MRSELSHGAIAGSVRRVDSNASQRASAVGSNCRPVKDGGVSPTVLDKMEVFISYAHEDQRYAVEITTQLRALGPASGIEPWIDFSSLRLGDEFTARIEAAARRAAVAVLLVSADFLNSQYINTYELPLLLKRQQSDDLWLIPIVVRNCPFRHHASVSPLAMETTLVSGEKPAEWSEVERVFAIVVERIAEWARSRRARATATLPLQGMAVGVALHLLECTEADSSAMLRVAAQLRGSDSNTIRQELRHGPVQLATLELPQATRALRELQHAGAIATWSEARRGARVPAVIRSRCGIYMRHIDVGQRPLWVGITPLTVGVVRRLLRSQGSPPADAWHPVHGLSAGRAMELCARLDDYEGSTGGYRLPSAAEWASLASSWTTALRDQDGAAWRRVAWLSAARPTRVARLLPSPNGLHDLIGNVAELTSTTVDGDRLACGGSFRSSPDPRLLTDAERVPEHVAAEWVGLRVVRDV